MGRPKGSKNRVKRKMGVSNKQVTHPYLKKITHLDFPSIMADVPDRKQTIEITEDVLKRHQVVLEGHQRAMETSRDLHASHITSEKNSQIQINSLFFLMFALVILSAFLWHGGKLNADALSAIAAQDAYESQRVDLLIGQADQCSQFIAQTQAGGVRVQLSSEQMENIARLSLIYQYPANAYCVVSEKKDNLVGMSCRGFPGLGSMDK